MKVVPAVLAALAFVGLAFLPTVMGLGEAPTVTGEGKIKMNKPKEHGDKMSEKGAEGVEVKALFVGADGTVFVGGKEGLYILEDGALTEVADFPGREVKGMTGCEDGMLLVASKGGLHRLENEKWTALHTAEGEDVAIDGEGAILFAPKKMGLLRSADGGKTWTAVEVAGLVASEQEKDKTKDKN